MPIRSVTTQEATVMNNAIARNTTRGSGDTRVSAGRTSPSITPTYTAASAIAGAGFDSPRTSAVTIPSSVHATISSIAAHTLETVPIVVVNIFQSVRIRVSTGSALMAVAVPRNRKNASR